MFRLQTILIVAAVCFLVNGCAHHREVKTCDGGTTKSCCVAPSKGKKLTH